MAKDPKSEAAILRQKAEELLKRNTPKSAALINEAEMLRLIHELEVHQIELEMQNEELVLAKEQSELSFHNYKDSMPTDEELQENNLKLELAMKAAKLAWWKMDRTTGHVTFGSRKAEMLGYLPEKFVHFTDFTALLHPEDYERTMKAMQDHLNGSVDKYEVEYRMLTKSNGYQWFYDIGSVVKKDCEGKPLIITGLVLDIGDRKRAEESLLASETRYRRLFESAKDGILILDAETGMILDANPFLIEMLHYSKDQFLNKAIWEIGFFKDIVANQDNFLELQQQEYVRYDDLLLETADGRKISVEFVSNAYLVNNKKVIQCDIRDITTRKKTEMALRISETHLRTLVQSIPDLIWLKDPDGVFLSCNPAFERLYGAKEADLVGKTDYDFVDTELADFFRENDCKAMAAGKPTSNEEWVTFANDGHRAYLDTIKTPLLDSEGKHIGVLGISRDITGRKQAEKEIAMLAHSLKSINECVCITDLDNEIIFVNESFLKTYGYDLNELLGNNISMVRSQSNEQKKVDEILPATILGEWQGELLNRRKNGSEFSIYLSTTIIKDKDNQPLGLIGVAKDISERKRSEETLLKLSSAIEQTVDSIMITDRKGKIEYVNHAYEVLTGYSSEETLGKVPSMLKSGTKDQNYYKEIWKTILSGQEFRADFVNKRKNGELYVEQKTISPIFDRNKNITNFVGIGVDITERKNAEKELLEAKHKAEESDRLKSAFLANMSHEVRTPLNSIIGFSELLADPDFDGDQKSEFIQHIIAGGNNLLVIISDIMDISKLESGEITIRKSQINVHRFIEKTIEKFSFYTAGANLELKLILPENSEETIIFADAERLNQIFSNLVSNAFKFTTNGQIEIGYQPKGKMAEFFVKDSGIGIPAEYHTKIFDRFRQVDNSTTRKFGGNGLGLAISKKLVELMGGKIWVISEPGVGSAFYFTLPIFHV